MIIFTSGCAFALLQIAGSRLAAGFAPEILPQGQRAAAPDAPARVVVTPYQLFDLAEVAARREDYVRAEAFLRTLTNNKDVDLRNEARFRLAMLLADKLNRLRDAATLLRKILDEKPKTARVRIELAKLDVRLGRDASAQIELRAAQAAGLTPAVARDVRFFMQALEARRRFGVNVEGTLMPDSNANRATTSAIIDSQLGDIALTADAREHSGLGANIRAQTYVRSSLSKRVNVLAQLSGAATVYAASTFDDFTVAPLIGPEILRTNDRITLLIGPSWRWYGLKPYLTSFTSAAAWQHTLDHHTQLRVDVNFNAMTNWRNAGESGRLFGLSAGVDRAITPMLGVGGQLSVFRQAADASAYSLTGGGGSAYAFREFGTITATVSAAYSHLEADDRLVLFTRRRSDNAVSASVSATLRRIRLANLSPLIRVRYEKNLSSVALYGYQRLAGEIGVSASF